MRDGKDFGNIIIINNNKNKRERGKLDCGLSVVVCARLQMAPDASPPPFLLLAWLAGCLPAYIYTCIESEKTHVHASCRRGTRRWFRRYNIYSFYEGDGLHYWENLEAAAAAGPIWRHLHHHRARHRVSLFFVCDPYLFKPIF